MNSIANSYSDTTELGLVLSIWLGEGSDGGSSGAAGAYCGWHQFSRKGIR